MAKITAMAEPRLLVVKKVKGGGRSVVNGIPLKTVNDLFGYYATLPRENGTGTYDFEVFDPAGTEKDRWTIQLGADNNEEGADMGMTSGYSNDAAPAPPPGASSSGLEPGKPTAIGNGYYLTLFPHDPTRGWLTTPSRQMIEWHQGMQLPGVGGAPPATATGAASAAATGAGGWGNYPAVGGESSTVQFYKDQLAEMERRRQDEDRRREMEKLEDKFSKILQESTQRYEALLQKLTEKPAGPSPEVLAMQARLEAAEKAAADAARRAEDQQREDRFRSEMAAMQQRFEAAVHELRDNKPDAMLTLLPTLFATIKESATSSQGATVEYLRSISDQVMKPEKVMELIRMAKDRGPDAALNKEYMEAMRGVFEMTKELVRLEREASPGEPVWLSMLRQGMDRVGSLGQSYMQYKAEKDDHDRRYQWAAQERARRAQAQQQAQAPQQAAQAAEATNPVDAAREAAASQIFGDEPAEEEEDQGPEVVQPDAVIPGDGSTLPPGRTPQEANARLAAAPPAEIRKMIEGMNDQQFFGPVVTRVGELRAHLAELNAAGKSMEPTEVADMLFQAQEILTNIGVLPAALELFRVEQFEVLLERLLPDAEPMFREHIKAILEERFAEAKAAAGDDAA